MVGEIKNSIVLPRKMFALSKPTRSELIAIKRGREEIKDGKYVKWSELKNELVSLHSRKSHQTN